MRIIIVGAGKTAEVLVRHLEKTAHDVIVVDKSGDRIEEITNNYSVNGVCGSGASREVLLSAGADTADLIISLTQSDEINLLACETIMDQVCFNAANRVEPFFDTNVLLAEITVDKDSILADAELKDIKPMLGSDFLIFGVLRNDKLMVPPTSICLKARASENATPASASPKATRQICFRRSLRGRTGSITSSHGSILIHTTGF